MELIKVDSKIWGEYQYCTEYRPKTEKWEVTSYIKPQSARYKYYAVYHRDQESEIIEEKEYDWTNVIIGRGHRLDAEFDHEPTVDEIELEMQNQFDEDDLYGFHIVPVKKSDLDERYAKLSNDELWKEWLRFKKMESVARHQQERAAQNQYSIWLLGEDKYGWEY